MKRLLYVLTIAAFMFSVTAAVAAGQGNMQLQAQKMGKAVNCCVKGKCKKAPSAADCAKAGGKVVKDCKDCK
ncbi:MAG: hypothetical protein P8182_11390 [Deltaproteobacteria bacterium]